MKISKQETITERYIKDGVEYYVVTRNNLSKYTLYKVKEDDYEKIKMSGTPIGFREIVEKDGKQ